MRNRWLVPAGAVAAALVVAACGSSSSGSGGSGGSSGSGSSPAASAPAASSGSTLATMKIGSATVLTNAKGLTLYWFVPDTSTKSTLYTYVGDTGPGMDKGNGLNLSGGVWHAIILTGNAAPAASPSASSGGGGYGY